MKDGDSKISLEKNFLGKRFCKTVDARDVLQPIWVRHNTVLSLMFDREFMECKLNFVFIVGFVFWSIYLVSKVF